MLLLEGNYIDSRMRSSALLLRALKQTAVVAGEDAGVQKASGQRKAEGRGSGFPHRDSGQGSRARAVWVKEQFVEAPKIAVATMTARGSAHSSPQITHANGVCAAALQLVLFPAPAPQNPHIHADPARPRGQQRIYS